jgi:hypothetical protein
VLLDRGGGLIREISYLHADESRALEERAKKERASKAEIIRRASGELLDVGGDEEGLELLEREVSPLAPAEEAAGRLA